MLAPDSTKVNIAMILSSVFFDWEPGVRNYHRTTQGESNVDWGLFLDAKTIRFFE